MVLTSHKLLRWLTAPLLAIAVIATVPLARTRGNLPNRTGSGDIVRAGRGNRAGSRARRGTDGKATFAYQFIALNCAQAVGLWRCFAGEVPVLWEPRNL